MSSMKRTTFDASRDQRIANESGEDRSLYCVATGCPNKWSVDPPRACGAHAWSEASLWPSITQRQLELETERTLAAAARIGQPPKTLTREEKFAILGRMQEAMQTKRLTA